MTYPFQPIQTPQALQNPAVQMSSPAVPPGAQASPIAPPMMNPGPSNPVGPNPSYVQGWDKFLQQLGTDQNLQMSMVQAGLQMMTPKRPGENYASKLLQGTQVGVGGYQQRKDQQSLQDWRKSQIEAQKVRTEGQQTANTVAAATAPSQIKNAEQRVQQGANQIKAGEQTVRLNDIKLKYADKLAQLQIKGAEADIASQDLADLQTGANTAYLNAKTENEKKYGGAKGSVPTTIQQGRAFGDYISRHNPGIDPADAYVMGLEHVYQAKGKSPEQLALEIASHDYRAQSGDSKEMQAAITDAKALVEGIGYTGGSSLESLRNITPTPAPSPQGTMAQQYKALTPAEQQQVKASLVEAFRQRGIPDPERAAQQEIDQGFPNSRGQTQ